MSTVVKRKKKYETRKVLFQYKCEKERSNCGGFSFIAFKINAGENCVVRKMGGMSR